MLDTRDYARQVRRSLLPRALIAGVPQAGIFIVMMLSLVFCYGFEMYFMLAPIAVIYVIMRVLTSRDQYMIDMVLENMQQKDVFVP